MQNPMISIVEPKSESELRASPRIQVLMNAKLYEVEDRSQPLSGIITNISLKGISLETNENIFEIGEQVNIDFAFLPKHKLMLTAKVVRSASSVLKTQYGLEYFNLTEENKEKLRLFLQSLL